MDLKLVLEIENKFTTLKNVQEFKNNQDYKNDS